MARRERVKGAEEKGGGKGFQGQEEGEGRDRVRGVTRAGGGAGRRRRRRLDNTCGL